MCEELIELNATLPISVHVLQQVVHLVVRRKHSFLGLDWDCDPATTHQRIASDCQALLQTRIHFHEYQTFCERGKCVDGQWIGK